MSLTFLLTAFVVVAIPGTGAIYTLSAALARGARAGLLAALACTLGIVPHLLAALTGLAALLNASAVAFQTVKYVGVVYLLWMAWQTWRDDTLLDVSDAAVDVPVRRVLTTGVLVNLLNPKLTVFFFAFLPQFVAPDSPSYLAKMLVLSGVFMAMTFAVFATYGLFAAVLRSRVVARPKVLDRVRKSFAGIFVLLGAKLALTPR